jgi:hypothetical protein
MASFVNFGKPLRGNKMFDALANINWEIIFQLTCIGLIVVSGPVVIFLLAFRNGDM